MSETLQILEKLNNFYAGAFGQLIAYTVGLLAFVGVLIPGINAFFQNRQLKNDQATLLNKISIELSEAKNKLNEELSKELAKTEEKFQVQITTMRKEFSDKLETIDALAIGRSFHVQAQGNSDTIPYSAAHDALSAIPLYIKGKDERNIRSVLLIIQDAYPKILKKHFDILDIEKATNAAIASLEGMNETGRYTFDIKNLKRHLAIAKERMPPEE